MAGHRLSGIETPILPNMHITITLTGRTAYLTSTALQAQKRPTGLPAGRMVSAIGREAQVVEFATCNLAMDVKAIGRDGWLGVGTRKILRRAAICVVTIGLCFIAGRMFSWREKVRGMLVV